MNDGKHHVSGAMNNQEWKLLKSLGISNQGSYLWQNAPTHQHHSSNEFWLCERDTGAHNGSLAEAHQVDLFGISAISRDSFAQKCNQPFTALFSLLRINYWPLRREVDLKP